MKRSEINRIIDYTVEAVRRAKILLPAFAYYSEEEWLRLPMDEQELIDNMLGWDITDFGSEDYKNVGLTMFTYRNGNFYNKAEYPKPYAEKLLYVMDGQVLPFHYHWSKMEDIINRAGGDLKVTVYNCTAKDFADRAAVPEGREGEFDDSPVELTMDGKRVTVPAGGSIVCKPGSSVTLKPGQYHSWQALPGTGDIILSEVSTVNDDTVDNRFKVVNQRIPQIEEDEKAKYFLFADYHRIRANTL